MLSTNLHNGAWRSVDGARNNRPSRIGAGHYHTQRPASPRWIWLQRRTPRTRANSIIVYSRSPWRTACPNWNHPWCAYALSTCPRYRDVVPAGTSTRRIWIVGRCREEATSRCTRARWTCWRMIAIPRRREWPAVRRAHCDRGVMFSGLKGNSRECVVQTSVMRGGQRSRFSRESYGCGPYVSIVEWPGCQGQRTASRLISKHPTHDAVMQILTSRVVLEAGGNVR
jgi:hypothetical protein